MHLPRLRPATPDERAADFWAWWPSARDQLGREVQAATPGPAHAALVRRIARIDRRLDWLIEPGSTSQHRLILVPFGHPLLRELALAWHAAAPQADGTWEFAPSRPARRELPRVEIEDQVIDTAETRVEPVWDPDREVMNLSVWHAAFAVLAEPDAGVADEVVLEGLVALLGDDDTERWLGSWELEPLPDDAMKLAQLREWLERASAGVTRNRWVTVVRRNQRDEPVAFRFNAALKRIDYPLARDIVAVDLPRRVDRVEAVETPAVLNAVRDLERELGQSAVRATEVSEPARLTVRFATEDGKGAAKTVERWSAAHRGTWADVRLIDAPEWVNFRHGSDDPDGQGPAFITPPRSSALDRRSRWIERHPWRLIGGPLVAGALLITLGAVFPSLATTASGLFIVAFGVGAIAVGVYVLAHQYLVMREHAAVGCLSLLVHGWVGVAALGVGFLALVMALLWLQYGGA
ncbi:MAG TPA: hypothetical protein VFN41_08530 [Candidatus Limnocylindrales bacterium]|nr:hypothetical protein [Candidatus Limnocylindrales bacterium]